MASDTVLLDNMPTQAVCSSLYCLLGASLCRGLNQIPTKEGVSVEGQPSYCRYVYGLPSEQVASGLRESPCGWRGSQVNKFEEVLVWSHGSPSRG